MGEGVGTSNSYFHANAFDEAYKAAAAGAQSSPSSFAGFTTSDSEGAEFEVTAAPDWDQDSSTDPAPGEDEKV